MISLTIRQVVPRIHRLVMGSGFMCPCGIEMSKTAMHTSASIHAKLSLERNLCLYNNRFCMPSGKALGTLTVSNFAQADQGFL
jgi:hypothetical protein